MPHPIQSYAWFAKYLVCLATIMCVGRSAAAQCVVYEPYFWYPYAYQQSIYQNNLRAQAAYLESAAYAEQRLASAEIYWQQANRLWYENERLRVQTYWEMKQIIQENRAQLAPKPFVGVARARAIQSQLPPKLASNEFNAATGRVTWPAELQHDQYSRLCRQIDSALLERTSCGNVERKISDEEFKELCLQLHAQLKSNIRQYKPNRFMCCHEFILALKHRATPSSTQVERLASM